MRTDATDRLAKLLKIEKPDIGHETEQALELAANEIERLRSLCDAFSPGQIGAVYAATEVVEEWPHLNVATAAAEVGNEFKPIYDSPNNRVRAAVAAEREECAKVAEEMMDGEGAAAAIRARKDKP